MSTPRDPRSAGPRRQDPPAAHRPGLREQRKAQTRRAIQEHALRLFLSKGYEATTVAEIATAAGVSHMTFFRYFASKEAVVENDDYDPLLVDLVRRRPRDEGPLTALRSAIREGLELVYAADRDGLLVRTRLILQTPALRARMAHNLQATQQLFAETLAARAEEETGLDFQVIAAAALAALTTAITTWAVDDSNSAELPDLIDRAFDGLLRLAH